MEYLLSVDGGGTKTKFRIANQKGELVGECESGSSNYKSVGTDGIFQSFSNGFSQMKELFGIQIQDIAYSVWGISGCDSKLDYQLILKEILRTNIKLEQVYLCNDGILAYYAQTTGPGMVIIAGTGSIVFGIDDDGSTKRAGGWGYNISDIGSGYWIGVEALKETLLYCDDCRQHSKLFDGIGAAFQCENKKELPYLITEVTNYFEIAKFAQMVTELAEEGEPLSQEILEKGAEYLSNLTVQIYNNMNFGEKEGLSIVYSGGVMKNKGYQRRLSIQIEKKLNTNNITFLDQKNDPAYGGICLAMNLYPQK